MTTLDAIYEMPNIGCLLGMAYQAEAGRLGRALAEAKLDITPAEYIMLRILFANGSMQQCEISRMIGKDRAAVSRCIRSLEKKGYAVASQVSYKCSIVSLTEKGESIRPGLLEIAERMQNELCNRISLAQIEALRQILKSIIKERN